VRCRPHRASPCRLVEVERFEHAFVPSFIRRQLYHLVLVKLGEQVGDIDATSRLILGLALRVVDGAEEPFNSSCATRRL